MKVTIVPSDALVIIDGIAHTDIDMSSISKNVNAVQFEDNLGWVEYFDRPNEPITNLLRFQTVLNLHQQKQHTAEMLKINPYYGLTDEERLEAKREHKMMQVSQQYQEAEDMPYMLYNAQSNIPIIYAGGLESTRLLSEAETIALRLDRDKAITTNALQERVELPIHSDTDIDIKDVVESLALRTETNWLKLCDLLVKIRTAQTEEELDNITW